MTSAHHKGGHRAQCRWLGLRSLHKAPGNLKNKTTSHWENHLSSTYFTYTPENSLIFLRRKRKKCQSWNWLNWVQQQQVPTFRQHVVVPQILGYMWLCHGSHIDSHRKAVDSSSFDTRNICTLIEKVQTWGSILQDSVCLSVNMLVQK